MNKVKDRLKKRLMDESGAMVIVEATFVFPIMFFVLFFLFFMGNMYFTKAYTDNLINQTAIKAATMCADPNYSQISKNNKVPDSSMINQPYRYIFTGGSIATAKDTAKRMILNEENSLNTFFKGMEPRLNSNDLKIKFNNNIVNYSLSVTAKYKISLPWKFLFENDVDIYTFTSRAEVPVTDAPEFIRNIDMAIDYLEQSKTVDKAKEAIQKLFNKGSMKNLK